MGLDAIRVRVIEALQHGGAAQVLSCIKSDISCQVTQPCLTACKDANAVLSLRQAFSCTAILNPTASHILVLH